MIVPRYWAEARVQQRAKKKQITVRRFGWSDVSQADAEAHANTRAQEALAQIVGGKYIARRERKMAYNGADGVPIREEIVERYDETIVTRTTYGARCINSPNALFADIDFDLIASWPGYLMVFAALLVLCAGASFVLNSILLWFVGGVLCAALTAWLTELTLRAYQAMRGGPEKIGMGRIAAFMRSHPDWGCRIYRTPNGLRVLVTHRPFSSDEADVERFFRALDVDKRYALMCRKQKCFRARVSAKPWRMGTGDHMRPRPSVWPVAAEKMDARRQWIDRYEVRAAGFAACRFVSAVGSTKVDMRLRDLIRIHDELAHANQSLPLA
jgi:hypothetical protein